MPYRCVSANYRNLEHFVFSFNVKSSCFRNTNGYTYFFKKGEFYRFDPKSRNVDADYPKPMEDYVKGIPKNIDAAFTWYNGGVYFFKENMFWFFKIEKNDNDMTQQSYPRSINVWWNDLQNFTGYSVFR